MKEDTTEEVITPEVMPDNPPLRCKEKEGKYALAVEPKI